MGKSGAGLLVLLLFFVSIRWTNATANAATPSASEILQKADEARGPSGDFSFEVQVKDYEKSTLLHEQVYKVYTKGTKLTLVETQKPLRLAGRKLLMRDRDLWLYLPTIKRPTRVSLQQRLTGEVANGDIARTSFYEDYSPRILGNSVSGGKNCYQLELTAKHKDTTYRKILLWVEQKKLQPVKADFFAISGKLLKRSTFEEYSLILGSMRASRVVIRDALQPTKQSHLKYYQYRRETLDDSFFSKESMP